MTTTASTWLTVHTPGRLGGTDAASFDINAADGQLMTKAALDYEAKSTYTVVVTVRDSSGEPNDSDRITVTIEVKDLDEKPETTLSGLTISGPSAPSYAENGTAVVATYTAASLMADSATWSLEGDDADHLMVEGSGRSVMLKFMSPPDYEMPMDMGMDNGYEVILKASAGTDEAMRNITVKVTNDEDKGMVELSSLTPVVDVPLTATLTDPDGSITGGDMAVVQVHDHERGLHADLRCDDGELHAGGRGRRRPPDGRGDVHRRLRHRQGF